MAVPSLSLFLPISDPISSFPTKNPTLFHIIKALSTVILYVFFIGIFGFPFPFHLPSWLQFLFFDRKSTPTRFLRWAPSAFFFLSTYSGLVLLAISFCSPNMPPPISRSRWAILFHCLEDSLVLRMPSLWWAGLCFNRRRDCGGVWRPLDL